MSFIPKRTKFRHLKFKIRLMRTVTNRTTAIRRSINFGGRRMFVRSGRFRHTPDMPDMPHAELFSLEHEIQYGLFDTHHLEEGTSNPDDMFIFSPLNSPRSPIAREASVGDVPRSPLREEIFRLGESNEPVSIWDMLHTMYLAGYTENKPLLNFTTDQFLDFQNLIAESNGVVVVQMAPHINAELERTKLALKHSEESRKLAEMAIEQAKSAEEATNTTLNVFMKWVDSQSGLLFFSKSILALTISQTSADLIKQSDILSTLATFLIGQF